MITSGKFYAVCTERMMNNMKRNSIIKRAVSLALAVLLVLSVCAVPILAARAPTGDLDGNNVLSVSDILKLKNLILSGSWSKEDLATADLNGNGKLDVADILRIKTHILNGESDISEMVEISVLGQSSVLATGVNNLEYKGLKPGDSVEFHSNYQYLWVKINDTMGETLVYAPSGVFTFQVPRATDCYPNAAFSGNNNISARVATAAEIAERRNLAVNAYDFRYADEVTVYNAATADLVNDSPAVEAGAVQAYPHAYANRVTENKTIFQARNAIDGVTSTGNNHSNYPYQSWGCGQYNDVEFVVYFGREVKIDELAFVLRADFSGTPEHDTYWESITAEFSDGSTQTFKTVKGGQKQTFKLNEPVTTSYVRLKNLVRHQDANSAMWAALIELEAYGSDVAKENPAAVMKTVKPDFGGKEIVETIDTYSADEIAATIDSVYDYFTSNLNVRGDGGWEAGVYYLGVSDAYMTTGNLDYYLDCRKAAESFNYMVNKGTHTRHADWYCISQMYLTMNDLLPADFKVASVLDNADYNVAQGILDYWWCDALFMSCMVFTELTNLTGDARYSDINYQTYLKWRNGTDGATALYDEEYHLWYRDEGQKGRKTDSGQPVFWSRGDGWVFASLARQLAYMPDTESEAYKTYLQDFRDMAASLKKYQREDGTWNPCINDPNFFGGKESTGTSGFLYGFAIGVELGILDREEYLPVALKAYDALTGVCMVEPGKIGYMQAVAGFPDNYVNEAYSRNNTLEYGIGLFLLGASALMRMCEDYEAPELIVPLDDQNPGKERYSYDGPPEITYVPGTVTATYSNAAPEAGYLAADGITASASAAQAGNEPINLIDGNWQSNEEFGVRWSVEGYPNWAMLDLGKTVSLEKLTMIVYQGRQYYYQIQVSTDGKKWDTVVITDAPYQTAENHTYTLSEPVDARYVRLTVNGCNTASYGGAWISIKEMMLYTG